MILTNLLRRFNQIWLEGKTRFVRILQFCTFGASKHSMQQPGEPPQVPSAHIHKIEKK